MDADLQHPPELIPRLLDKAVQTNATLVVASRYCQQGNARGLNGLRTVLSHASTTAAHTMFPIRLGGISDPMSGFFLVQKEALDLTVLQPRGFKILLEILVRTPGLRVAEVGFAFGKRYAGQSKASLREGVRYATHLTQLRFNENTRRFLRFVLIGLSGLIVNTFLLAAATEGLGLHYLLAAVLATQGSTLWNFVLTEAWVFRGRHTQQGRGQRLAAFFVMNNAALALRGPMMYLLTTDLGIYYILSNILSLLALMVLRYTLADHLIWGARRKTPRPTSYHYSIHGIITVTSEVWLPELERFLISEAPTPPTILVRISGKPQVAPATPTAPLATVRTISYKEGLRSWGFGMDITMGDTIEVQATPLLRYSPHVLYTNVVEPILRWTFVQKGYALVHGACIAVGKDAYLVTARTDTGKTTTMLRILAHQRRASDRTSFLSDDLTLLARDGQVLAYPKPLTISNHTVRAINSALLTSRERLVLPFQSRIHSRSGRRFAFLLTQTHLPVATINTLVQFLVPPPKYHVQRLVPNVKVTQEANLAGMFVIERGGTGSVDQAHQEALDILMTNCEDAYGFPPYPVIKHFLHTINEVDLRALERDIVTAALTNRATTLLRSSTMDWAERIAAIVNPSSPREELRVVEIEPRIEAATVPV